MVVTSVRASGRNGCRCRRTRCDGVLTRITTAVLHSTVMPAIASCHVQPRGNMPRSDQTANKHNEGGSDQRAHGAIRVKSSE